MLQIFKDQPVQPNIFQEFEYMDYREDWLISQRQMQKMYKQNMSNMNMAGYYSGYGSMYPQMNYMYQGYGGIPGVGYNREFYDEKNGENKKKHTSPPFIPTNKEEHEEEKEDLRKR